MNNTIDELKKLPIPRDAWMDEQVGFRNSGPYKTEYPKMQVVDSQEKLVSLRDYGLVSSDFYLCEYISGEKYLAKALSQNLLYPYAFLRKSHALRLQKIDNYLRQRGYFLHVQSGWRHPDLQVIITNEYARKFGEEAAKKMFAPVIKSSAPPPHATGAAFDVEIRDLLIGERQELYYCHEGVQIYSSYELEALAVSEPSLLESNSFITALQNRRILYHCMSTCGVVFFDEDELFTAHPGECWHFGDGDPLSAYLRREKVARYGFIEPEV